MHNFLMQFIESEKKYFEALSTGINWNDSVWLCKGWIPQRGGNQSSLLSFTELNDVGRSAKTPLPHPYSDFVKAFGVYLYRVRNAKFNSIQKYGIECRKLYKVMKERMEETPEALTRWHFETALKNIVESTYKNKYDAASALQVIAETIDRKQITSVRIDFKHGLKVLSSRHSYVPLSDTDSDKDRKDDEKLPSLEALKAYAICTNNPISDNEEILLRTLDLLIVMGQRGNEIVFIPLDCWVEKDAKSRSGKTIFDNHGNIIKQTGIRYFAEKNSVSKVHWLADQDVVFAKRAVDRLVVLTKSVREIAMWQENNPGRLWNIDPNLSIQDDTILEHLSFASHQNLHLFLERNNIKSVASDIDRQRINKKGNLRYKKTNLYKAGEIEELITRKYKNDLDVLMSETSAKKVLLRVSEVLSIRFYGAYQFKERSDFVNYLLPGPTTLRELNTALGSYDSMESIFDRRQLLEANGDRIKLTSHQPRHWRNTIYDLAGMSNVQQALALGRQRLDQNPTYQHTSLLERTQTHRDFLSFKSPKEKMQFLHDGIREKQILGEITKLYHELKSTSGDEIANTFLKTHATAIHLTPYGGCTHDFSQAPCPKHLQCWNGCGHLHRTNTPGEAERIQEQITLSTIALNSMKIDSDGEFGADVWVKDIETKIENMQKALDIKPDSESPVKVFPDSKPFTIAFEERKGSSISD